MLTLVDIFKAFGIEHSMSEAFPISEFVIDSRRASMNSLFIALQGEHDDGHNYVKDAFTRGSSFAIIDHNIDTAIDILDLRNKNLDFNKVKKGQPLCLLVDNTLTALQKIASYWRQKFDIQVVGITGSVGKSSTKDLIASVLSRRFITLKSQGNMNNEIGLPLSLLNLRSEHEVAVLEMGFYVPGEIKLLCDIAKPQIGVVTNIDVVHAERAGSQEAIVRGKTELVQALPSAPEGVAVLNFDDPFVKGMALSTKAKVFYYGFSSDADLWADEIEGLGLEGIRCQLHYKNEKLHVKAPLIGRHSVYTLLRAASVALIEGMSWEWIIYALQSSKVQLRLSTVKTTNGALLIDDTYNASPASTLAALNLLNDLEGRKVAVLGDMLELGPYEKQGHEKVGIRAAEVADEIVLVGDRSKIALEAAKNSGFNMGKLHWFLTPEEAAKFLEDILKEGDTTLVKGSHSMHMDRIVSTLEEKC